MPPQPPDNPWAVQAWHLWGPEPDDAEDTASWDEVTDPVSFEEPVFPILDTESVEQAARAAFDDDPPVTSEVSFPELRGSHVPSEVFGPPPPAPRAAPPHVPAHELATVSLRPTGLEVPRRRSRPPMERPATWTPPPEPAHEAAPPRRSGPRVTAPPPTPAQLPVVARERSPVAVMGAAMVFAVEITEDLPGHAPLTREERYDAWVEGLRAQRRELEQASRHAARMLAARGAAIAVALSLLGGMLSGKLAGAGGAVVSIGAALTLTELAVALLAGVAFVQAFACFWRLYDDSITGRYLARARLTRAMVAFTSIWAVVAAGGAALIDLQLVMGQEKRVAQQIELPPPTLDADRARRTPR